MTDARARAIAQIENSRRFAALIAGLQKGTTLTEILQDRARREELACTEALKVLRAPTPGERN